jgi:hypothetical protein
MSKIHVIFVLCFSYSCLLFVSISKALSSENEQKLFYSELGTIRKSVTSICLWQTERHAGKSEDHQVKKRKASDMLWMGRITRYTKFYLLTRLLLTTFLGQCTPRSGAGPVKGKCSYRTLTHSWAVAKTDAEGEWVQYAISVFRICGSWPKEPEEMQCRQ